MIQSALLAGQFEAQFDKTELNYTSVANLIDQVISEIPEIIYYMGGMISSNGTIKFIYSFPIGTIKANQAKLQSETDRVLTSIIKIGDSDFDKLRAIHAISHFLPPMIMTTTNGSDSSCHSMPKS